jgi:lysozyme
MALRDMLIKDEGRRSCVYGDILGIQTIGVGRNVDARHGGGLSDAEIDYLLDNDIAEKTAQVDQSLNWAQTLDEPRKAVLVSMAFQLGIHGLLEFTQTLAAVRDERYEHAAQLMLDSLWAKQTPQRAQRLSRQMATGQWQV